MTFTAEVYEQIRAGCIRSADRIVPVVYTLARPRSVIDVGCGEGWFARAFAEQGCRVVGVDPAVEAGERGGVLFVKDASDVPPADRFDLAVCLEVAEHLPEGDAADLVTGLVESAPLVLFSAAIPGQSGHGHVNCRWPQYWADLFAEHGYLFSETLRWRFWDAEDIEVWYRQNLFLVGRPELLTGIGVEVTGRPRPVVHPGMWSWKCR